MIRLTALKVWPSAGEGNKKWPYIGEVITWSIFHLSCPHWGYFDILTWFFPTGALFYVFGFFTFLLEGKQGQY